MTNPEEVTAVVQKWVNSKPQGYTGNCKGVERKVLIARVTAVYVALPEDIKVPSNMNRHVGSILGLLRGITCPQNTRAEFEAGEVGGATSDSQERMQESNMHEREKKQDELQADVKARYHLFDGETILDLDNAAAKALEITESNKVFRSMVENGDSPLSFYIFYTSRELGDECWRFLSMRGKNANPVLRHSNESIITKTEMLQELGFKVQLLFESKFMVNARDVEDALQKLFQHLPLGESLWREPDCEAKREEPDGSLHKVGIVFSKDILPMIKSAGVLKLMDPRADFKARYPFFDGETILDLDNAAAKALEITESNKVFRSMVADVGSPLSFYIFYTSKELDDECSCFLSSRGKNGNPVLRHSNESIITKTEMLQELGFKVQLLFESKFMVNARDVEGALQKLYLHLPLGERLWRQPDRGAKWEKPDGTLHKVGIVFSKDILPMIKSGVLKLMEGRQHGAKRARTE
eukprot:scaffold4802_cov267-Chaetoceros_neogracile.AAC.1